MFTRSIQVSNPTSLVLSCYIDRNPEHTCIDGLASTLEQQQLIKGLKDVYGGLVDGAHNGPACVDNVTHRPHNNSRCSGIQP